MSQPETTCADGGCGRYPDCACGRTPSEGPPEWKQGSGDVTSPLGKAIERVLIGGNHLALLIGPDHPPYTAGHEEALAHYHQRNNHDAYEAWCCWRTIMELRDAAGR